MVAADTESEILANVARFRKTDLSHPDEVLLRPDAFPSSPVTQIRGGSGLLLRSRPHPAEAELR